MGLLNLHFQAHVRRHGLGSAIRAYVSAISVYVLPILVVYLFWL